MDNKNVSIIEEKSSRNQTKNYEERGFRTMKTQKELKEEFMNIIINEVWPNDLSMHNHMRKKTDYIVELSNGDIISLEKPNIKTKFTFGYGLNLVSTNEEHEEASNMARYAETSFDYFKEENMKDLKDEIENLKQCLSKNYCECYTSIQYYTEPDTCKLVSYSTCYDCQNPEKEPWMWYNHKKLRKLDKDDIQLIIDGLEIVLKNFEKRLDTYLKKYGLSKIQTWTYLVD